MKIILKYILNNLQERKIRTAVMLLSVVMSTTLLFVSLSIGDSYESAQQKMAKGFAGTATISVSAMQNSYGEMVWISEEDVPELASIKNKVGIVKTPALYNEDGYFENFSILAADLEELNQINKPRLLSGGELTDFIGYDIVLPEKFTSKYELQPGDKVSLHIGETSIEFRLVAVAAYDTVFLRSTRGFNALVPKETLQEILNVSNRYSEILVEPTEAVGTTNLKTELLGILNSNRYSITAVYNETQVVADARQKSMPFFLITFFSLTMSIFIIFSSYKVITMERLPVIGTFRSIGATKKAVTKILMMESLLYGVLGGLIGIPLGFGVLKLMLYGLGESLSQGIEIPMVVLPLNIILSCVVAISVSLLSAYLPVRRASKLPVKDVVLGMVEEKNMSNRAKLGFGILLLVLSLILPRIVSGQMLTLAGGFSLLGLIAATIMVIPLITTGISYILERIYSAVLGNEGKLAARNMKQNKNINQNVTLLFISISAVIAISVVGSFVNTYIGDVFKGAELDGFADAQMNAEFIHNVESIGGVEVVLPIYVINGSIRGDGQSFGRLEAIRDLSLYNTMFNIKFDNETIRNNAESIFNNGRNILLSKDCLQQRGIKVGDAISLTSGSNVLEYRIIGSFQSRATDAEAIISAMYAESDFGVKDYGVLAYTAADPDAVMIQIRNLFGNQSNWSRTVEEFNNDALGVVGAFLEPMQKLLIFILLLATIGIINNLLINYIQKRHSIAMYRSIGLSNKQNIKITMIEGFSSGLIGAAIGIAVSYQEIKTIFLVAGPKISIEPELDAGVFLMAGLMGIVITLIGSIVPILKGSKMKLVEEIKFE